MRASNRVLLVEDEEIIAIIIKTALEDAALAVEVSASAEDAWRRLRTDEVGFDAVILDRGLPDLDGMELLRRIKNSPDFSQLPVIMETAQSDKQSIQEGLDNGAYYYLTKPFQPEIMLAVVSAALQQCREYRELAESVRRAEGLLDLLHEGHFRFRDLDQARLLANNLARACPQPDKAVQGLLELLINAVEHGNLAISYIEKGELLMNGLWLQEIQRRLRLPEYRDRCVTVGFQRGADTLSFVIRDQGDGFDWRDFLDFSPERAFDLHGRGIAMARKLSVDHLQYHGNGNTVAVTFNIATADSKLAG